MSPDRLSSPGLLMALAAAVALQSARGALGLRLSVPSISSCSEAPDPAPATSAPSAEAAGMCGPTLARAFAKAGVDWSRRVDAEGLARFLRAVHPEKTAINVGADTKLPADTVKKWLLGSATPNGRAVVVLACTYGPEALAAMLREPPDWLVEAARRAERTRLEADLSAIEARLGRACFETRSARAPQHDAGGEAACA